MISARTDLQVVTMLAVRRTPVWAMVAMVVCVVPLATAEATAPVASVALNAPQLSIYIDALTSWWPPTKIASGLGVPGYAPSNAYTTFNLAFWTTGGPVDTALVWADAFHYVGAGNPWGNSTAEVQSSWRAAFHKAGKKVLVSAFGSTDMPTSQDPTTLAEELAAFVRGNQLDGADIDYEDNNAMNVGKGEAWLVTFTNHLRSLLPRSEGFLITHAPQAPYFMGKPRYPNGGYLTVDKLAGAAIDYYNVQFYNQVGSTYSSYGSLFVNSTGWATGTSIGQMVQRGIPGSKILLGKPVAQQDAANTGYVPMADLAAIIKQGVASGVGWNAGVMGWQYRSDPTGSWSTTLASALGTSASP